MAEFYEADNSPKCESAGTQALMPGGRYIPPTKRQQLEAKKANLEFLLKTVNDAIAALDAHPDLEEFAEKLSRAL